MATKRSWLTVGIHCISVLWLDLGSMRSWWRCEQCTVTADLLLVVCVPAGAAGRSFVPEDRLHVTGRHYLGRVLYVHAARVRWDGWLVPPCTSGRLPAAGQVDSDAAPRPDPPHSGHVTWWLVYLLQSGRTHHILVTRHAATPLQVYRGI